MVPANLTGFLTAATAASGALIGLLFIAISLHPEATLGPRATVVGRTLASNAYAGLVNVFFLSLVALIPGVQLGICAIAVAVFGLGQTARIHRGEDSSQMHRGLVAVGLLPYLAQLGLGVALIIAPAQTQLADAMAYVIIASLAMALARAWSLVQGRHVIVAAVTDGPNDPA